LSLAFSDSGDDPLARQNGNGYLFAYEARKDGRTVVVIRGKQDGNGAVTVETEILPVTAPPNADPQVQPYVFTTREQAARFVDEALLALEYLGCTLAE
jgi:hypothetical protein